jgi:hypothetical protein
MTAPHPAILEKTTVFPPAAPAVFRGEEFEHILEISVFFKNRILKKGDKPSGKDIKISELFSELTAEIPDLAVLMGKTLFAVQPAGA